MSSFTSLPIAILPLSGSGPSSGDKVLDRFIASYLSQPRSEPVVLQVDDSGETWTVTLCAREPLAAPAEPIHSFAPMEQKVA